MGGARGLHPRERRQFDFRVSVFTGPVFAEGDEEFAGVPLPRQFWKIVVMVRETGELSATAYLLSQEELISGLGLFPESFSYGEYRTYQVRVRRIEELTSLSFGSLAVADPLDGLETTTAAFRIARFDEIVL